MATGSILSRFDVVANTLSISGTVDTVAFGPVYIAAGTYYLDSATAAESFRQAIDDALEAGSAGENFTVAYGMDTGLFTITCTTLAGTWSLTFNQALADIIGWGSTLGFGLVAGAAQVSPEVAQYVIFPGSGRSQWIYPSSDVPSAGGRSGSGVSSGVGQSTELIDATWLHAHERMAAQASPLESGTRDDAGAVRPWVWYDFFKHHKSTHQPFRFYDGTGLTVSQYERAWKLGGKSLSKLAPPNQEEGSSFYWQVFLEVEEWKAAT